MENSIRLNSQGATADIQLRGGEIASWRTPGGREIIWQADPAVWGQHAPILFPVCGSVKNERIRIAGKEYPMTKHGFTRNAPFLPVRRGEDFVELVLNPTEESRRSYPFDYELRLIYTLEPNRLDARFVVENRSEETIHFGNGVDLEALRDGEWKSVHMRRGYGIAGFGLSLNPGESYDALGFSLLAYYEEALTPGLYRACLTYKFGSDQGRDDHATYAEFEIRDGLPEN